MGFTICNYFWHKWNGCKCKRCGKTRDEYHNWKGSKCIICSKTRDEEHEALGSQNAPAAIPALIETMQNSSDRFIPRRCAESLRALNFQPQKDAIGALYWHYLFDDEKCAECGAENAIPLLLKSFVGLGDGWDFNERWRNTYFMLGDVGFMPFVIFSQQIFAEYKKNIHGIDELNYALDIDKQKATMIEYYSKLLIRSVETISKYGNIQALEHCVKFYKDVKYEIYSHTEVGFLDMFNAVTIRKNIVGSFSAFPESLSEQTIVFLCDVLENDPSYFVRWAAVDILYKKYPLQKVSKNQILQNALRKALLSEPNSISSRKEYILKMLGDNVVRGGKILTEVDKSDENKDKCNPTSKEAPNKLEETKTNKTTNNQEFSEKSENKGNTNDTIEQTKLAEIAKNGKYTFERIEAVRKLTNQNILADFAKNDKDWTVSVATLKNLTDQSVLVEVAKNSIHIEVRVRAIIYKLTDQTKESVFKCQSHKFEQKAEGPIKVGRDTEKTLTWEECTLCGLMQNLKEDVIFSDW